MGESIRVKIRDAYAQIKAGKAMFEEGLKALSNALETVGACEDHLLQRGLESLPECNVPVTEHRKEHRMGRAPKIDCDPELQAFLIARIDRLTYAQIAQKVAEHFPEPRRVGKSAIHAWFKKRQRG
ncbi:hypothetical protein GTA62_15260 [Roseobacter sp. HKCCD9010]|uniref:hypothetical protein n=1 Tax=unclassified Roseobacter TaxID=196798 RepID=UPI0014911310|nr:MULTISPECIES: hypothetical protein [unclassified Roseobacter]MBF9050535.1 hypothetical protein [Rhodobacterales bacterium HKCCD4356]NNV12048.1 hypothetical protein [Roseobacter sp. HKCCD7357]NNV17062.1 hypothetical protein [Roseobacter sp. HKCCD8768]NNV26291.1 hypothetical protein [Roseobacter sp. HKCCD8192]NNV30786.1 hypothetical protein [Roseobacter sp. HKCCD9061]